MNKPLDEKAIKLASDQIRSALGHSTYEELARKVLDHLAKNGFVLISSSTQAGESDVVDGMPKQIDLYKADSPGSMHDGMILQFQPHMKKAKPTRYFRSDAAAQAWYEKLGKVAQAIIDTKQDTYKACNNREVGIQADDGERAWYFTAGDPIPQWLKETNMSLFAGVDLLVTSRNGGFEIRPQRAMFYGDVAIKAYGIGVTNPFIRGGGNGVEIIGYTNAAVQADNERLLEALNPKVMKPLLEYFEALMRTNPDEHPIYPKNKVRPFSNGDIAFFVHGLRYARAALAGQEKQEGGAS